MIVLLLAGVRHNAAADDAIHPLVPSRRDVSPGTLFESGLPPAPLLPLSAPASHAELLAEGAQLYGTHCASCHGAALQGTHGVPALSDAGGAATDFYLTTGRMPLAVRGESTAAGEPSGPIMSTGMQADHAAPHFDAQQIAALDAFMQAHAQQSVPIPRVVLDPSTIVHGRELFESNCEACHGAAGQGATAGDQWIALPLGHASSRQIGEAIRIGPGVMPRFTSRQLSDADISAIATYVRDLTHDRADYGGTTLDDLGPFAEGAIGAFGGVGLLFWVIYFTGTKADGRRVHERDDR